MQQQANQLHVSPWKDDRATNPGYHFQPQEGQKVIRSSHHAHMEGKLCLANLTTFHRELSCLLHEWRAMRHCLPWL